MKTERLKEDADASKGFVISFDDDDKPKKPKPELKNRRLSSGQSPSAAGSLAGGPGGLVAPGLKKHSLGGETFSSDGSNSSRKENVPPSTPRGVMICIDMNNTGNESSEAEAAMAMSPGKDRRVSTSPQRKYSAGKKGWLLGGI